MKARMHNQSTSNHYHNNHQHPPMTGGRAAATLKRHFDLMDTAAPGSAKDGKITQNDLKAILENPGAPAELREAAQFLLNNPAYSRSIDANNLYGIQDNSFSKNELSSFAAQEWRKEQSAPKQRSAQGYGCNTPQQPTSQDGLKNIMDLLRSLIGKQTGTQPQTQGAGAPATPQTGSTPTTDPASGSQSTPSCQTPQTQGTQAPQEAQETQPKQKMNAKRAMDVLKQNLGVVDTGKEDLLKKMNPDSPLLQKLCKGKDGLVSKGDLEAVLRNPDVSQEIKDACSYLLNHPEIFGQIDGATAAFGIQDGLFDLNDLNKISQRYYGE